MAGRVLRSSNGRFNGSTRGFRKGSRAQNPDGMSGQAKAAGRTTRQVNPSARRFKTKVLVATGLVAGGIAIGGGLGIYAKGLSNQTRGWISPGKILRTRANRPFVNAKVTLLGAAMKGANKAWTSNYNSQMTNAMAGKATSRSAKAADRIITGSSNIIGKRYRSALRKQQHYRTLKNDWGV